MFFISSGLRDLSSRLSQSYDDYLLSSTSFVNIRPQLDKGTPHRPLPEIATIPYQLNYSHLSATDSLQVIGLARGPVSRPTLRLRGIHAWPQSFKGHIPQALNKIKCLMHALSWLQLINIRIRVGNESDLGKRTVKYLWAPQQAVHFSLNLWHSRKEIEVTTNFKICDSRFKKWRLMRCRLTYT